LNASIVATKGFPKRGVYNASKAAVRSFARTWAAELAPRQIRVNSLSPGPIDTAIFVGVAPEAKEYFKSSGPLRRMGKSEEIATAALFLASDDSSFVTGIDLAVDGGTAQV
jgi:NAD(P)-dependent dehydrogenase (short-subunit alcohol dehydrogenase family)